LVVLKLFYLILLSEGILGTIFYLRSAAYHLNRQEFGDQYFEYTLPKLPSSYRLVIGNTMNFRFTTKGKNCEMAFSVIANFQLLS
jgi:hypothetical protein